LKSNREEYDHLKLREKVIEQLRKNIEKFGENGNNLLNETNEQWVGPYIEDDYPYNIYLSKMGKPGEWADNIVIQFTANVIKRKVVIVSNEESRYKYEIEPQIDQRAHRRPIYLGYKVDEHYLLCTKKQTV
jgi:hypothetical protein